MMKRLLPGLIALLICFGFFGCTDKQKYSGRLFDHGMVITNEGNFNSNNGSISFYSPEKDTMVNNVFEMVNNRPLGDIVQSFAVAGDMGLIVVNNSQKVEVVELNSFKSIGVFHASYPRFFIPVGSEKGYLTNGSYPGQVLVINLITLTVNDTIIVGNQPEHLLKLGNKVFVANGKWGNDSTISVIDATSNSVIRSVVVSDGPVNLVARNENNLWIICQGKKVYNADWTQVIEETDSRLVNMDAQTYEILYTSVIGKKGDGCNPFLLSIDKTGNIYYAEADGVHKVSVSVQPVRDLLLIPWQNSSGLSIYGLTVDMNTSNIYILEPRGYISSGLMHVYNATGQLLKKFEVGIAPNGAVSY